ncbi:hypothetical protein VNI00_009009 [Paramarasmius palmivorus]|uniref:F-box domain-containing protein n=1 Tax=Paramarasmius palmivorus TaxID=297713 RepID=A0AAW0CRB8_9AGAR
MQKEPFRIILCNHCNAEFTSIVNHPPIPSESLQSHSEPTNIDRLQTLSFIIDEEREIKRYQQELERLHEVACKLASKQAILEGCVRERRSWISAIPRIPKEVWCEIFTLACESQRHALTISAKTTSAPPLVLSHVSSYWRDIIVASPKLWSTISVYLDDLSRGDKCMVKHFLQNSGSHPLELVIDGGDGLNTPSRTMREYLGRYGFAVLKLLVKALPRCRKVEFAFESMLLDSIPDHLRGAVSFPLLQHLSYNHYGDAAVDEGTSWFWEKVHLATHITTLMIRQDSIAKKGILPGSLTYLIIGRSEFRNILSVLRTCRSLQSLEWSCVISSAQFSPSPSLIVAPCLSRLVCSPAHAPELNNVIASVTLPAIATIDIMFFNRERWEGEGIFAEMLERSRAPLRYLKLNCQVARISVDGLGSILRVCACLTALKLMIKRDEEATPNGALAEILPRFCATNGDILLPKLRHLILHEVSPSATAELPPTLQGITIDVAESRSISSDMVRAGIVSALQTISVSFSPDELCPSHVKRKLTLDLDIVNRFRALKDGTQWELLWFERNPGYASPSPPKLWHNVPQEGESDSDTDCDADVDFWG